jgi:hypothetical protein
METLQNIQVTPEMIAGVAGAVLALVFSFVAGLNTKYAAMPSETKALIMAVLLLVVSGSIFGLQCAQIIVTQVTCDKNGVIQLVWMFVISIMGNQGTYNLTKSWQSKNVKAVKAARVTPGVG